MQSLLLKESDRLHSIKKQTKEWTHKQKEKFMEHQEKMYSMQGPTGVKQYDIFEI